MLLPRPPVLALRGAGTHDGKRKKRKKLAAKLAARDSVQALREGAALRAKRAKEKEAFRLRMARRRKERELAAQEEEDSEDDGAGLRYAMTLPAEERQKILDELRALEPPLPDVDNPQHEVPRLTDAELLGGLKPPAQPLPFGLGGGGDGGSGGTGGAGRHAAPARKGGMVLYGARGLNVRTGAHVCRTQWQWRVHRGVGRARLWRWRKGVARSLARAFASSLPVADCIGCVRARADFVQARPLRAATKLMT